MWTRDFIYIAKGELLLDTIPLHEVLSITEICDGLNSSQSRISTRRMENVRSTQQNDSELQSHPQKNKKLLKSETGLMHLKTISDGFNAGRMYQLKSSETSSCTIVSQINAAVKAAKRREDRKSYYLKSKEAVRRFQESFTFQVFVSLMIAMVLPTQFHQFLFSSNHILFQNENFSVSCFGDY